MTPQTHPPADLPVARPVEQPLDLVPDADLEPIPVPNETPLPVVRSVPTVPTKRMLAQRVEEPAAETETEDDEFAPTAKLVDKETPEPDRDAIQELLHVFELILSPFTWLFGLFCVILGLALLAAVPVANFLCLGYLLECGGRMARTGSFGKGFVGIRIAGRLGGIVLACWLLLLPVRFLSDMAYSASIIDPGGSRAAGWRVGMFVLIGFTALHILLAVANGGKLRHFFHPFNAFFVLFQLVKGGFYTRSRDAVWDTLVSLRLPYYFMLGVKGFGCAGLWLVVPITLIAMGRLPFDAAAIFTLYGMFLLALVLMYLPFLQLRLAETGQFSDGFDVTHVRRQYRKAPVMFLMGYFITLLFALPLYLLKVEVVPKDAAWLPSLFFVAFIYPARMLCGWAMARATRRREPRNMFFRWSCRLGFLPLAGIYVVIVYFTQYISWHGLWSLYEQHAFLLPVPFLEM